ncbi:MAG TPA: DUF29 domain-containing protein [Geminicoccaceae bacterium]|nr:DUF29 domain-containing protein [Geminicoccaceae bacterium]
MARSIESLYEDDFFAWTQLQARELDRFRRTRPNVPLDLRHLAEEIRDLGKEQRNALRSWTARIIEHLLLLEHSPARDPRPGWSSEIVDFRAEIEERLTATLRRDLARRLPQLFADARRRLAQKLGRQGEANVIARLPEQCPYSLDQILGDWWPDEQPEPGDGRG